MDMIHPWCPRLLPQMFLNGSERSGVDVSLEHLSLNGVNSNSLPLSVTLLGVLSSVSVGWVNVHV